MAITRGLPSQNLEELLSELTGSQDNGELIRDLEILPSGTTMTLDTDATQDNQDDWVDLSF